MLTQKRKEEARDAAAALKMARKFPNGTVVLVEFAWRRHRRPRADDEHDDNDNDADADLKFPFDGSRPLGDGKGEETELVLCKAEILRLRTFPSFMPSSSLNLQPLMRSFDVQPLCWIRLSSAAASRGGDLQWRMVGAGQRPVYGVPEWMIVSGVAPMSPTARLVAAGSRTREGRRIVVLPGDGATVREIIRR